MKISDIHDFGEEACSAMQSSCQSLAHHFLQFYECYNGLNLCKHWYTAVMMSSRGHNDAKGAWLRVLRGGTLIISSSFVIKTLRSIEM